VRVAAFTLSYPPKRRIGSELATHDMLRHVAEAGHDVEVFTKQNHGAWSTDGIPVTAGWRVLGQRASEFDVVVTHAELWKWVHRLGKPTVGITHNARIDMLGMVCHPWSLLVHNSQTTADTLAGPRLSPHLIVNPPVDYREWTAPCEGGSITLVNVTGEKGSDTFYEMARRFPQRQFLGVLGGWGEPDVRDEHLNVTIEPHGVDMRDVYRRTRILLMPSEHESWGRVAVEAMSRGIPVIATDLPGIAECLGGAGFLVELDWWDEYARLIVGLDNLDAYRLASERAKARAVELDPGPQLDRFVECLEALVAGRRGPWVADGLTKWRHRNGRTQILSSGSPQDVRLAAHDAWEGVPA
jgi:hypothetical protein